MERQWNINWTRQAGVYKLTCDCGKSYVGETGCKISTRIQQHQNNIRNGPWDQSGVSEHALKCHGQIDWHTKILKVENHKFSRKVREALEIQRNRTGLIGMNKDNGLYVTNGFWKPLMKHIDTSNRRHDPWRQYVIILSSCCTLSSSVDVFIHSFVFVIWRRNGLLVPKYY